jgi:hypothetical protein
MDISEIEWNEPARAKIIDDANRVLREAVVEVAKAQPSSSDEAFAALNAQLKDQFIDYEPSPDLRKYADAIVGGEIAVD